MSFLDNWRMMVKEGVCDICEDDWYEILVKDEPKEWRHENCLKREYFEQANKYYHSLDKKEICFVFRADCGGDGFSLCKKHLQEVLDVMKDD